MIPFQYNTLNNIHIQCNSMQCILTKYSLTWDRINQKFVILILRCTLNLLGLLAIIDRQPHRLTPSFVSCFWSTKGLLGRFGWKESTPRISHLKTVARIQPLIDVIVCMNRDPYCIKTFQRLSWKAVFEGFMVHDHSVYTQYCQVMGQNH